MKKKRRRRREKNKEAEEKGEPEEEVEKQKVKKGENEEEEEEKVLWMGFFSIMYWDNGYCPDPEMNTSDETSALEVENVAGVFLIVACGIVLACLVALAKYNFPNLFRLPKFLKKRSIVERIVSRKNAANKGDVQTAQV
ncbi:glutamate receptor 2 [Plakobranchus ocellatus]|uniref:Glutamate receptor 2 n=1 Tax=Plakobranchus ocellatus TaxID=259542 RepID=A0AAV4B9X8_9GAST|nr:glutamate receptor 2 [Plakobranchus ocellatus]